VLSRKRDKIENCPLYETALLVAVSAWNSILSSEQLHSEQIFCFQSMSALKVEKNCRRALCHYNLSPTKKGIDLRKTVQNEKTVLRRRNVKAEING